MGYDLGEMEDATKVYANNAAKLAEEVQHLIEAENTTLASSKNWYIKQLHENWEEQLGLYFPGILYFHIG